MIPLGWGWALLVWGYALAWFLVSDRVKALAYRVLDRTAAPLLAKTSVDVTPALASESMNTASSEAAVKSATSSESTRCSDFGRSA